MYTRLLPCLILCTAYQAYAQLGRADDKLLYKLMKNYQKVLPPSGHENGTVVVEHGLSVLHLTGLSVTDLSLTIHVWLHMSWADDRLSWSPEDYDGIGKLKLPVSSIWIPDIVLYNSASKYNAYPENGLATINSNGQVSLIQPDMLTTYCDRNTGVFGQPLLCRLKFGSWVRDGSEMDIVLRDNGNVDLNNYEDINLGWTLQGAIGTRNIVIYQCCPEPYVDVTYTLKLQRRFIHVDSDLFG
ncbi:hypothetical protein ACJMK2_019575 [Sinanodonta woodiana]|uniref:Neurotransmitter-gated ion-channel ligand-binding domain-containing protein n=1 Tax=Sinanodonta woodiana TaxID=1069815 RepID=A0ABD3TYR4_SINWO